MVTQLSVFVFLQILVIISLTSAVVVFRVIAADFLAKYKLKSLSHHSNISVMVLGGFLHYFIITIMTRVHRCLKVHLFMCLMMLSVTIIILLPFFLQVNWIVARKLCDMGMFNAPNFLPPPPPQTLRSFCQVTASGGGRKESSQIGSR